MKAFIAIGALTRSEPCACRGRKTHAKNACFMVVLKTAALVAD